MSNTLLDAGSVDADKAEADPEQDGSSRMQEKLTERDAQLDAGSVDAGRAEASPEQDGSCQMQQKVAEGDAQLNVGFGDADRAEAYPEQDGSFRLQQKLAERDAQLDALRKSHEQFRMFSDRKELGLRQEKEVLIGSLEESELRFDKQRIEMQELENRFSRVKGHVASLEKRCAAAETRASESSSLANEVQSKLDGATMELFELKNSNAQNDNLRMRLQECERALSLMTSQKALAEKSLGDLKLREEHIEKVEHSNRDLQDRLKWRNEQFQSLEEAHAKVQLDFKKSRSEWDTERTAMHSEIDSLRETLDSRERSLQDLQNHVQMVHQALSHEESRRKVLELQAAEWREGLEQATVGYESAQSSIEALRERTSTDIGGLRHSLAAKERKLNDLQVKFLHMERECEDLREVEKEYRIWQSSHGEQQQQFSSMKEKMISMANAYETLRSQMKEQAENFEQEKREALDSSHDQLLSKDETLKRLEEELCRANGELEHVKAQRSRMDIQLTNQIRSLEAELKTKYEEADSQSQRVSLLEVQMKESSELRSNMQEQIASMRSQAHKGSEDLRRLEDMKISLEGALGDVERESLQMKRDLEGKLNVAGQDCSALSVQLKAARDQLQDTTGQNEILLRDLDLKSMAIGELMELKKTLLTDTASLRQAVQVLETKNIDLLQEVESGKKTINQVCDKFESAQSNLDSSRKEVKDLCSKLHSAQKLSAQLSKAQERSSDLEGYLQAAKAIADDKEEKLAASEWAVQQLALDLDKVKAVLSRKDRDEAVLRYELAEVERQLQEKEGALIEAECYLEEAVIAKDSMADGVQKLQQMMEDLDRGAADWKAKEADMTTQLEVAGADLEEKREALVAFELELKRNSDLREGMVGAIESLKMQLAHEQRASSAQQANMSRLCEDLERNKGEANSSAELVKELQARLQQLEQSSDNRIKQLQSALCEVNDELSLAHVQLDDYQSTVRSLTEESSRFKEKCEALTDLTLRKESSLNDLQAELSIAQASALQQSKLLEQRDHDLQRFAERQQYQDEKQSCLEESLSRVQSQRSELQFECNELVGKLVKLTGEADASSNESILKAKEIESLKVQLEQTRAIVAQEEESRMVLTNLTNELQASSRAVQDRDVRLRAVKASLDDVQAECQALREALATKECDVEALHQKLSTEEQQRGLTAVEVLKLEKDLQVTQNALTEQSKVISSHLDRMNALDVEANKWKEEAQSVSKQASSLVQQLHVASSRCLENEKKTLEVEELLTCLQLQLTETAGQFLVHVNTVEELERDIKLWKETSAAAIEEKLVLKGALAEAAATDCGEDVVNENLKMELETAEDTASNSDILENSFQAKSTALRIKESTAEEKRRDLSQQLEAQRKAEVYQQQIAELQEALEKSRYDVEKKAGVQHDLAEERMKGAQSVKLIADLRVRVEEWKAKAEDAERMREAANEELKVAARTISSVQLQLEAHKEKELSLEDLINVLKDESNAAQEEASARKEKMMSFLLELERSQATAKGILGDVQIEKVISDLDSSVGFEFEACEPVELLDPGALRSVRGDEVKEGFILEEPQASEECTIARVNDVLESEVTILKLCAEEAKHEGQQLAEKLDSAFVTISAKDQVIKQFNDEIQGLRSLVKKLEQEMARKLEQDSLSVQGAVTSRDANNVESKRDAEQQSAALGKRKAETQQELDDYLLLCEKLIREKGQLQRQVDGYQRKNRALQKQLQAETLSSQTERRVLDPVDCSPEHIPRAYLGKSTLNIVKPIIAPDTRKGKVLFENDENAVPGSLEISQISRRPPVSPGSMIQQKRVRSFTEEI